MAISETENTEGQVDRKAGVRRSLSGVRVAWRRFSRGLARYMPKRLYARSLIIVIAPMLLLQSVVAFVFMERHWQTVTQRLSTAVVRDIAAIIDVIETYPQTEGFDEIRRIGQEKLALKVDLMPPDPLPAPGQKPFFSILDQALGTEITRRIGRPFWLDTVGASKTIEIRIQLENHVLRVFAPRGNAYASNTHIFLVWMFATSLVLLTIAILFLRNQIRPIQKLAEAAESFGKGRPMPEDFRPRGAEEVRRAGSAFIQMRERIERQIEQRTDMLNGVSHDLRTILTRFKLQLALGGKKSAIDAMNQDVEDMQSMLEGYMAFARGEGSEESGELDLSEFLARLERDAELRGKHLETTVLGPAKVVVRPNAFSRLINNVVSNALRYAANVQVTAVHAKGSLIVTVDDDGPGIPEDKREEVFRPFYRLDEARNQDASGTGLGLSIARDIARSHGGDITLDESPSGGLRVNIRVPA